MQSFKTSDVINKVQEALSVDWSNAPNIRVSQKQLTQAAIRNLNQWSSPFNNKPGMFQVIDFFSGSGGMSLGFAALSTIAPVFEIIGGCDIDLKALESFEANFNAPGINADVIDTATDDSALEAFMQNLTRRDESKPLVIIGCAPCQGFSSHRKKHWHHKDSRNTLVGVFAALAVSLDPVCIVMENVPEILGRKYWEHFAEAKDTFNKAGYTVKQSIYSAASFGTPQERFRTIVIAHKKDFLLPEPIVDADDYVTVRDAIGDLPKVSPGESHPADPYHRSARHRRSTIETIRAVPHNGGNRPFGVGPKCLDKVKGFSDVYGRLSWDRPAITITQYARNPASGRYVHPEQDRGLTMREAARLQGFPDSFQFIGSLDTVFKQIGEAVPPHLACGVAANVLTELLSPEPTTAQLQMSTKPTTTPVSSSYSSVIAGVKRSRVTR